MEDVVNFLSYLLCLCQLNLTLRIFQGICAQMTKACKVLDALLDCQTSVLEGGEMAVKSLELLATDAKQLLHLYFEKLKWMVREVYRVLRCLPSRVSFVHRKITLL